MSGYSYGVVVADTLKRTIVPLAALVLSVAFVALGFVSSWWWAGLFVTVPIVALGLYDWFQRDHTLTRNFPVAARSRWLFHKLRPYLRSYIVEGDLEGRPFSFDERQLVFARARDETDTHPFGTERDVHSPAYEWLSHSMSPHEQPDHDPRVRVGQGTAAYEASVFNISAMSFGSLSAKAVSALNLGAKRGGFYHDTGEGGVSPYHLEHGGDLVWEIGSGYFGCRDDNGNFDPDLFEECARTPEVKMVEIKLSQGAKPGHGGMLPGSKVTAEIARVRKVEEGQDCVSPRGHREFSTPKEMLEFSARLRDLSGGKPVGIKLCVGQTHEVLAIMKAMLATGIHLDYIVVDGGEGGTGAAPLELTDHVGMPLTEGLITVRNALVGTGLRERVNIAASAKVYSGMGLARNLAIGADWCNAARAFMMSVGCVQSMRCHLGTCPTGVTSMDPARQRGLVVPVQGQRAERFHRKTVDALVELVAAAGLQHPSELRPHHLVMRVGATDARAVDRVYPFLEANSLLDAPQDTPYAWWWDAADPDSFSPRAGQSRRGRLAEASMAHAL